MFDIITFNFHWYSKYDKIEWTDLKISDRMQSW
jgi:hypothetical protein